MMSTEARAGSGTAFVDMGTTVCHRSCHYPGSTPGDTREVSEAV